MARALTSGQRTMLRSDNLKARLLSTWYMDAGTVRFCDDPQDMTDGTNTWVGASALASCTDIRSASGDGFAAESITVTVDGTRMSQSGFVDPAGFFRTVLSAPLSNRRVDMALGIAYETQQNFGLVLPLYAGKINNAKLIDPEMDASSIQNQQTYPATQLQFQLDSMAARYSWASGRLRTHQDQQDIDPTDMFFSYVTDNVKNEYTLYWGEKTPTTVSLNPSGSQYGTGVGAVTRNRINALS